MGITEQEKREQGVVAAIHSTEMEGGRIEKEQRDYLAAYARGELTVEQLQQRGWEQVARMMREHEGARTA